MSDTELRGYARRENDYILRLLLVDRQSPKDPEHLAKRNCGATERSFGDTDPLHAMALDTYAFVLLQREHDAHVAFEAATRAISIVRGVTDEWERLLEARCLAVLAKARMGTPIGSALQDVFELPDPAASGAATTLAARRELTDVLRAAVLERAVTSPVLIMSLRDVGAGLLKELSTVADEATMESVTNCLLMFIANYYASEEDEEDEEEDDET